MRRILLASALVGGLFAAPTAARALTPSPSVSAATKASTARAAGHPTGGVACGPSDLPETGIQGDVPRLDQLDGRAEEGYNCGVDVVGHSSLGGRGGNANMAWSGTCAYVAGEGNGIAVVDVSDPRHPRQAGTLHGSGSDLTIETLSAWTGAGRAVLVAGRYGLTPGIPAPMDIYDVRNCAHPRLVTTYTWPNNIHNLTFSPDGTRVYATLPTEAINISNLARPRFLGNLDDQIPQDGSKPATYLAHEVWTSPDGNLLYLGGQTPEPGFDTFTIVDISHWPAQPPVLLSQVNGRGHSIRLATINGRTYALHSEESIVDPTAKGCLTADLNPFGGASQPWLSDVTDPRHPVMRISQFRLAINDPSNCATQVADQVNASVHYHDVDNATHTTFAMLSMWNAGLRIADLRDPYHPREAAYFNPGALRTPAGTPVLDQAWGHVRYLPQTGQIWFATATGGFWVVELEPQVRAFLGLPALPSLHPAGGPARPASTVKETFTYRPQTAEYYCTLGALRPY
ncbi:MAG TPA: hypothetical protein VGI06_09250 [Acidimicrobiales bacterium]